MQDVLNTLVEEVVLGHDACALDKERGSAREAPYLTAVSVLKVSTQYMPRMRCRTDSTQYAVALLPR